MFNFLPHDKYPICPIPISIPKKRKNNMPNKPPCLGCWNIKGENLPFYKEDDSKDFFIDQEDGSGWYGASQLLIFFCPVCGKKLK